MTFNSTIKNTSAYRNFDNKQEMILHTNQLSTGRLATGINLAKQRIGHNDLVYGKDMHPPDSKRTSIAGGFVHSLLAGSRGPAYSGPKC